MQQESVPKILRLVFMYCACVFRTCSDLVSLISFPFVDILQVYMANIRLDGSSNIQCMMRCYLYWNQIVR